MSKILMSKRFSHARRTLALMLAFIMAFTLLPAGFLQIDALAEGGGY